MKVGPKKFGTPPRNIWNVPPVLGACDHGLG